MAMTANKKNMRWQHATSPSPQQFKSQASAGKIICTVFCNAVGLQLYYIQHYRHHHHQFMYRETKQTIVNIVL